MIKVILTVTLPRGTTLRAHQRVRPVDRASELVNHNRTATVRESVPIIVRTKRALP